MFRNARLTGRGEGGTALLVVLCLVAVTSGLLAAMMTLHLARDQSQFAGDLRLARMAATEAGLERARLEVSTDGTWLLTNLGRSQAVFTGGANSFTVDDFRVTVNVTQADVNYYLIKSTAVNVAGNDKVSTTIGMTGKGGTMFSDYARFVSQGVLDIGDYATYGGKVHCNSNINCVGSNILFEEDVTAHGNIQYNNKKNVVFMKRATPGVPEIPLPGVAELEALAKGAPAGALVYDYNDATFRNTFKAATGSFPASDLVTKVTFKQDKMDVVCTSGGKTMTQSNVNVPNEGAIFCRGTARVVGNVSRRTTISTPGKIYMDGPIRYTDDSGVGQYQLQDAAGNPMPFDTGKQSWSHMGNWTGPGYQYVEAADWAARQPVVDGQKLQPALGLVSADTIYVSGENDNREIHAALFSSGDVIRPNVSGQKKNLYILGCIITTGTNPVSSYFSYRVYAYDYYLRGHPPPGFPGGDAAQFHNWHVMELEKR